MSIVLYVGDDLCRHTQFMEHEGITVFHSDRSAVEVVAAISENPRLDAIVFEHHTHPLPLNLIPVVRWHSDSPLVLFENPNIARFFEADHDENTFDLIIPALTPPVVWLKTLRAAIAEAWILRAAAQTRQREAAEVVSKSLALRRSSKAIRQPVLPFNLEAIWCGEEEGDESPLPDFQYKKR